jgi:hypothetical protein
VGAHPALSVVLQLSDLLKLGQEGSILTFALAGIVLAS